jgi:hypothetical protein
MFSLTTTLLWFLLIYYFLLLLQLLSTGKEVDIEELKEMYPLSSLRGRGYYEYLEASLEWHLHPEHTNIAGLDDYQRLVLRDDVGANTVPIKLMFNLCQCSQLFSLTNVHPVLTNSKLTRAVQNNKLYDS